MFDTAETTVDPAFTLLKSLHCYQQLPHLTQLECFWNWELQGSSSVFDNTVPQYLRTHLFKLIQIKWVMADIPEVEIQAFSFLSWW